MHACVLCVFVCVSEYVCLCVHMSVCACVHWKVYVFFKCACCVCSCNVEIKFHVGAIMHAFIPHTHSHIHMYTQTLA